MGIYSTITSTFNRDLAMIVSFTVPICATFWAIAVKHQSHLIEFTCYFIFSIGAYFLTTFIIPVVKEMAIKADIFGMDINKRGTDAGTIKIPEGLGIVPGTVFLIFSIIGLIFTKYMGIDYMLSHITAILSVALMIFLGFGDDVFDLRWRHKLYLPTIASLPLVIVYQGSTAFTIPNFISAIIGIKHIELGYAFLLYMAMMAIFCTNSINIFAGINGLEVGQSIVIGCSVLLFNAIELWVNPSNFHNQLLSIVIILPFLFSSLGLFKFNKYPSQVFVGDTYCYFAGMSLAVASIMGHFPQTILLLFIPQIFNFVISLPQLFHIIPCPRHRLAKFDKDSGKLNHTFAPISMAAIKDYMAKKKKI